MNTINKTESGEEYNFTASNGVCVRQTIINPSRMKFVEFIKDNKMIESNCYAARDAMIEFVNWKNTLEKE